MVIFFQIFEIIFFCFVVNIFDLVHNEEAIVLTALLTANSICKYFLKYE